MLKNRNVLRLVAVILSITVLVTAFPLDTLATDEIFTENNGTSIVVEEAEKTEETEELEETAEEIEASSEPYILAELDGKRTETTKMFRMSDGSYTIAAYDQPIHFENEFGEIEEIDNTIVPVYDYYTADTAGGGLQFSDGYIYQNRAGKNKIQFTGTVPESFVQQTFDILNGSLEIEPMESSTETAIEVDEQMVSWTYEGMSEGEIEWAEPEQEEQLTGDERFLAVSAAVSTGIFRDAFAYTDLQYIVSPEGIKENIILKNNQAGNVWTLRLNIGNLTAVQQDTQTIELYGEEETPVMVIAAPMMTDANERISTGIAFEMESFDGVMRLTITADEEFLNSDETVFPVVVDPYFYLIAGSDISISDTFLSSARPSTSMRNNGQASGSLIVGKESSTYGKTRSLLKLNTLPKLPAGSVITEADLILMNYYSYSANTSMSVEVRRALSDWTQQTATWDSSSGSYEELIQDYYIVPQHIDSTVAFDTWEITRLVKGWYEGTFPNYGIMLTAFEAENASPAQCTKYLSSNYPTYAGLYPTFLISFRCNAGLEEYWTYHEQSVNGGSGYINDYSGSMVFTVPVAETTGENLPAEINFVYNSCISNRHYENNKRGAINGAGWMTTFSQRLDAVGNVEQYSDLADELKKQGFDYVWLDTDGTYHFFKKQDNGTYKDEDGLELTMKTGQIYGSYTNLNIIEDKNGNKTAFLPNGYLLYLANHLDQKVLLSYSGANLTRIIDGAGRQITFGYESSTITNP